MASKEEKKDVADPVKSEEESFFNQVVPSEKEKVKLDKDSILALYGNTPANNFNQFSQVDFIMDLSILHTVQKFYLYCLSLFPLLSAKYPSRKLFLSISGPLRTTRSATSISCVWRVPSATTSATAYFSCNAERNDTFT